MWEHILIKLNYPHTFVLIIVTLHIMNIVCVCVGGGGGGSLVYCCCMVRPHICLCGINVISAIKSRLFGHNSHYFSAKPSQEPL